MKRLILGIIAGLLTTAALSSAVDHILHTTGIYPPYGAPMFNQGLVALAFTYRAVFSVFGVYVASRIAQSKSATAARTLGIVGAVICWLAPLPFGTLHLPGITFSASLSACRWHWPVSDFTAIG